MKEIDDNYFNSPIEKEQRDIKHLIKSSETILWQGCPKKISYALGKAIKLMPIGILWGIIDFTILFIFFNTIFNTGMDILLIIPVVAFFAIHLTPF